MRKTLYAVLAAFLVTVTAQAVDFNTRACLNPQSEVFFAGMQRFVTMKNSKHDGERFSKTKYKPTSLAMGYQYQTEQLTAGIAMSYEIGKIKYYDDDEFTKIRDRMFGFTLFGEYRFGCGYYAKGSAFVGFASQKLKSGYDGADKYTGNGSASSTRFGASLEFGKRFDFGNGFLVTPHVGFDYSYLPNKDIPYRDAGVPEESPWPSQNFYEFPIGVTLAKDYQCGDWVFTPSVDLTLVTSVGGIKNRNMNGRPGFASYNGSEWKVYGIGAGHWGGRATAGIKAVKAGRFDVDFKYAYEGRKKYNDHRLSASVGLAF